MSAATPAYTRLPGRGRRRLRTAPLLAPRATLWLAADHLLNVDRITGSEEYRRFYFRDIQTFTMERTSRFRNTFFVLVSLLLVLLAATGYAMAQVEGTPEARWVFASLGGLLSSVPSVALLVHGLRGPTCLTRVRTAVQEEELPSLGRVRRAQKVLARLEPLVREVQGTLTPEEEAYAFRPAGPAGGGSFAPAPRAEPGGPVAPPALPDALARPGRLWHFCFFGLLALEGAVGLGSRAFSGRPVWLGAFFLLAVFGTGVAALIRQRGSALPLAVRRCTAVVFTLLVLLFFSVSTWLNVSHALRMPGMGSAWAGPVDQSEIFREHAPVEVGRLLSGLLGLGLLLQSRREEREEGPALPPPL